MSLTDRALALVGTSLMRLASPGGKRGLSILIYHRVLARKDPLFPGEVDRAQFDAQMALVKASCQVMPLIEAVRALRSGTLPPRAACITFDDGYADNATVALPVLQRHGLHATFFVATGFLNGGRMWNDTIIELVRAAPGPLFDAGSIGLGAHPIGSDAERSAAIGKLIGKLKYLPMAARLAEVQRLQEALGLALPDELMMNTAQLQSLHRAGMHIGGHTVNHPILARLDAGEARREMAEGKAALEAMTGAPVRLFAYPNGKPREDYLPEHVAMARELGFEGAVSTAWGARKDNADVYQLPRFTPWDRSPLRFAARLARNLTEPADRV
jgi:peptidoglycan/xylan/chitin deacetylase (PgdA/CDA1 family)